MADGSVLIRKQNYAELVKYDPSQPPYTAYQIDFQLYTVLFARLSPWGKIPAHEDLAARFFMVSRGERERRVPLRRAEPVAMVFLTDLRGV